LANNVTLPGKCKHKLHGNCLVDWIEDKVKELKMLEIDSRHNKTPREVKLKCPICNAGFKVPVKVKRRLASIDNKPRRITGARLINRLLRETERER